jgi:hypothetical protein
MRALKRTVFSHNSTFPPENSIMALKINRVLTISCPTSASEARRKEVA